MIQLIKMAYRDLGRNRRRSFFSALALGMGLSLLMLMASVIEGEMRGSMDTTIRLQSGHLQVRAKSYEEDKTSLAWKDLIENPGQVAAQIATLAPVKVATPRLFASGMVSKGDETVGVRILGIDPPSTANAPFQNGMVSGEFLTAGDREGILIGQALADQMGLKTGDKANLLVNTSSGDVAEQAFTIRGVYTTHTPGFDGSTVFMPLDKAQAIAQTNNHASTIFILLNDRDQSAAVSAALQSNQYQVRTWQQANALILETEQMANAYIYVLYLIVLAITATVIVNTLVMAVFERTREIGILSALGMKDGSIMSMFFFESIMLAIGGIAIGLVLGGIMVALASRYGFYIGNMGITGALFGERIYAYFQAQDMVSLTIVTFIVALLAALYPALLAARMEPVTALRGGK